MLLGIKNKQFEGIDHLDTHKINDFKQVGYDLIHLALKVKSKHRITTRIEKERPA